MSLTIHKHIYIKTHILMECPDENLLDDANVKTFGKRAPHVDESEKVKRM